MIRTKFVARSLGFALIFFLFLQAAPLNAQRRAPDFWISNLAPNSKRFNTRQGPHLYVISFFFVGCPPCVKEMPELYKMMTSEFPNVPLLFIDSSEEDTPATIQAFVERLEIPIDYVYHDVFRNIARKFMGNELKFPTIIGVYKQGIIFEYGGLEEETAQTIRHKLRVLLDAS